ncbi:MAG: GNAT family N-acetyltransferase [Corynebacterium sp.]|nr:GNAT family N-acetyltransferase [Corynebacterium sp.]
MHEPAAPPITITPLTRLQFRAELPHLVDLYIAAMGYDTALRAQRITAWEEDSHLPGFAAYAAVDTATETIVGIAYGFPARLDGWWHGQVYRGVRARLLLTQDLHHLLTTYFEVAEIHVATPWRGRGLGRRLLTALLAATSCPHALLSTPEVPDENNHAFHLYRALGFRDLIRNFRFSSDHRDFAILVRPLPLTEPHPGPSPR